MAPVPQKAQYWANMLEWGGYLNTWLGNNNVPPNDGGLANVYYDGQLGAYRLLDQDPANAALWTTFVNRTRTAYLNYYVYPNNGNVQGFRNFCEGPLEDILRGLDPTGYSQGAIQLILQNGAFVATGDVSDPSLSRECAYALVTHIAAQRAGIVLSGAQLTRMAQLKTWAIGHCNAWINNTAPYFRPFMGGLTAHALIYHYTYVGADPAVVTVLTNLANYAWTSCWRATAGAWGQGKSFLYTDRITGQDPDDGFTQPDLNMLIAPWWGWLYFVGAGGAFRTQGDDIFTGSISVYDGPFYVSGAFLGSRSATNPAGKQYFQQLYWGPLYIFWAEAGAGAGTAYTSAATGNWENSATWTPVGVPGANDTVTIANTHNVTLNSIAEIGDSPAMGNNVVTVASGGTLTLAAGSSLRIRGDAIIQGTGQIIQNAGSSVLIDSSLATNPVSTNYQIQIGSTNGSNPRWTINGTAQQRCTVASSGIGANGFTTDGGFTAAGCINATHTDFSRIGTPTIPAAKFSATGTSIARLANCTFTSCGRVTRTFNVGVDATYDIDNTKFLSNIDSAGVCLALSTGGPIGTGLRRIRSSVIDGILELLPGQSFDITDSVIFGRVLTTTGGWNSFARNFVRLTANSSEPMLPSGNMEDCFIFYDNPTYHNPHFIQALQYGANQTFNRIIFDMNCDPALPPQEGRCFMIATPGAACVATITNCISVVGPSNKAIGTAFSMLGNANTSVIAEHNTWYAGGYGASVGEVYAGFTGMVQSFRSNLVWSLSPNNGFKLYRPGGVSGVTNIVTPANCNYNGGFNLAVGNNGNNYNNLLFSGGAPGANDQTGNPNFADYTRNLKRWCTARGGNGTEAAAYQLLRDNPALVVDLLNYVREGFTPQNVVYESTAHDGGDIGAVDVLAINPEMYVTPLQLPANSTGNVVTLTGLGTTWVAGTPGSPLFSISGVPGAAITSQTVNSPTSATLVVTASTGGNIGVLTISDGNITAPAIVVTPSGGGGGGSGTNARRRPY